MRKKRHAHEGGKHANLDGGLVIQAGDGGGEEEEVLNF
jgi:hypothetical protein